MDPILPGVRTIETEMVALRHRIHQNPELAFEEHATAELVAEQLAKWGYEVHRGLGRTGIVGVLKAGTSGRSIGLRADMDALPIQESTGLPYASRIAGKMHACGHDGHTATLLAAARILASTRNFDGTVNLIFQPAEEGQGGGREMVEDGLFEKFPCDMIFAFHNMPGYPVGKFGFKSGIFMSSSDTVIVRVLGRGGHGSAPHQAVDPVVISAHIVLALQGIVSRQVDPRDMAVITVGSIHAGAAPNVIPESVEMKLSVRAYRPDTRQFLRERITSVVTTLATSMGAEADVDYQWRYPALFNDEDATDFAREVAREMVGDAGLVDDLQPLTGSEDFSFMLEERPGCYLIIGNGEGDSGGCMVHNPGYDFNDRILPVAASYWVRLVERFLARRQ